MVIDNRHPQRWKVGKGGFIHVVGWCAELQWQRHGDLGAVTGFRGEPDVAAHPLHHFTADKQPQAAALYRNRFTGRCLIPGIEQLLLFLWRNAAAAVAHRQNQLLLLCGQRQANRAVAGKFQRIGHQVVDHLLQAIGIDHHCIRQRRQRLDDQMRAIFAH